jgi:hypothetical protein
MKTPWHPPVPIETMFEQIEKGVKFATAGGDEPSANTIVRIGYNIIYATGRFSLGCHAWRQLIETDKTWARLKTHFKAADTDLHLTTTSNSAGFQGAANLATECTRDPHRGCPSFGACIAGLTGTHSTASWPQIPNQTSSIHS